MYALFVDVRAAFDRVERERERERGGEREGERERERERERGISK
jgi:hypothetical protein